MKQVIATGLLMAAAVFAQEPHVGFAYAQAGPVPGGEGNVMFQRLAPGQVEGKAGARAMAVTSDVTMMRYAFEGKPVKGAPYSAEAVTESTQVLADGNRIVHKNTSMLYRDSQGRSRREENISAIGSWSAGQSFQSISINDPVGQVSYVLDPKNKTARKMPNMSMVTSDGGNGSVHIMVRSSHGGEAGEVASLPALPPPVPDGAGATFSYRVSGTSEKSDNARTEQLGKQTIEGLVCDGTRTTITIPAGQMGNERPIEIVNERWYSPELQIVVMTKNSDPRMGETVYKLNNVNRAEPVPTLFQVPSDYTLSNDGPIMMRTIKRDKED